MKTLTELNTLILKWAESKGLLFYDNRFKQYSKIVEELGEVATILNKSSWIDGKLSQQETEAIKLEIGDVWVTYLIYNTQSKRELNYSITFINNNDIFSLFFKIDKHIDCCYLYTYLINVCLKLDINITECIELVYNKIKDRKGTTSNGMFIKE